MPSLVQHLTDPQIPVPDISHQEMLEEFSRSLITNSQAHPELKSLYTVHNMEDGNVAIVVTPDMRGLLYSEVSRDHLDWLTDMVCHQRVIGTAELKSILDGTLPKHFADGIL